MKRPGFVLRRVHKLHRAVEELIEALLCDAVTLELELLPGRRGGRRYYRIRWWNPAAWVAWSRTILFRDPSVASISEPFIRGCAFCARANGRFQPPERTRR